MSENDFLEYFILSLFCISILSSIIANFIYVGVYFAAFVLFSLIVCLVCGSKIEKEGDNVRGGMNNDIDMKLEDGEMIEVTMEPGKTVVVKKKRNNVKENNE